VNHPSASIDPPITLSEWDYRDPDSDEELKGLSLEADQETLDKVKEMASQRLLSVQQLNTGLAIRSFSYVGTLTLGRVKITIRPKIEGGQLLNLLRYASGLRRFKTYRLTPVAVAELGFQDLLIMHLIQEVTELWLRGLHRAYTATERDLTTPQGRIDFQRIAHRGGVTQAQLPCKYHPRRNDCLINQVLLAGLHHATGISSDISLVGELNGLIARLQDQVSQIKLSQHVLRRLDRESNRLVAAYRPSINIITALFKSQGITLADKTSHQLPGFLFDMNRFFQDLISRFLRENLQSASIIEEFRLKDMMSYQPGCLPKGSRAPVLRPDFVLTNRGAIVAILDTKYRDLWAKPLPREMLYQLGMYALSQPVGMSATILYPTTSTDACEQVIAINDPVSDSSALQHRAYIKLRPVNLDKLERLIHSSEDERKREKTQFAHELAFGTSS
jgi:5-methylcytosine-specific restriction enzyme subunit McrC